MSARGACRRRWRGNLEAYAPQRAPITRIII